MKQFAAILSSITLLLAMVACSKDKDSATAGMDITGNYKFISLQAKTSSTDQTVTGPSRYKSVTTSEYTSLNSAGTITIDGSKFITKNLSYSINSTAYSTLYENGVLSDTFSLPFQLTIPVTSATGTYKRISADSLYFDSGSALIGGSTGTPQPGGAKIKFENGKLTLFGTATKFSTTLDQGETVISTASIVSVIVLQKQ